MHLPLTLAISPYDHARGLAPQGIDLAVLELPIEEIFFRFTKFREWHASEMSFGKTVSLMAQEVPDIMPIPVFPSRVFRHSAIYLAEKSDIQRPQDLEGRKVGIPEWAQTAGIYARGLLQHEYGVDLARIQWYQAGVQQPGRIEKVKLHLPEGLRITAVPDKSLAGMLASGELDAVISARDPGGRRLFENYQEAEEAYFRKTRIYPIMHLVVLRRDAYERDRWIAMNLFKAFAAAKRESMQRLVEIGLSHVPMPWVAEHARRWRDLAGEDFWPYGIEPNRPTLEALMTFLADQAIIKAPMPIDDMFVPTYGRYSGRTGRSTSQG
jgi:4,5-dihydroxyphthalate decarboxylase